MTPEERIRAGGVVLALDTNALKGFKRLARLCNQVNLLREGPAPLDLRLCVPAVVHMELLFDLRQAYGPAFDPEAVVRGLFDKGLSVASFEERHAEHAAARLGQSFPDVSSWHEAKRKRCLRCLKISEQAEQVKASGKGCGATVDWVIAAHAAHEGWILVTNDTGPEFAGLEGKITLEKLEEELERLTALRRDSGVPVA